MENFPTCQPTGWRIGPAVALCWSIWNGWGVGVGWGGVGGAGGGGGECRVLWTRASLEAARALLSAVSKSVEGKITAAGGRGECRRRDSSSVGTVARTSVRSESRRERSRFASAGTAWLPTKARAFDPNERILSKLACAEGWRASRPFGIPRRWIATSLARIWFRRCPPGPILGR